MKTVARKPNCHLSLDDDSRYLVHYFMPSGWKLVAYEKDRDKAFLAMLIASKRYA